MSRRSRTVYLSNSNIEFCGGLQFMHEGAASCEYFVQFSV